MRIDAPDRDGRLSRVLLGYDDVMTYVAAEGADGGNYMGATCGRVANRIGGAAFTIDAKRYELAANEGINQRHGGPVGLDRAVWEVAEANESSIVMRHHSPDGDQGHPGALTMTARFTLSEDGELQIVYDATTTQATHVNIVSHGYFNLSGEPGTTIGDHLLHIAADTYLPIDGTQLPTGEQRSVADTAFDFRQPRSIGTAMNDGRQDPQIGIGRGYNHNFCLSGTGLRPVAVLHHISSGRTLTVSTDRPGLQLYGGGWLTGRFAPGSGVCLEAQDWPDACNNPQFASTRIDPERPYRAETRLAFGVNDHPF